MKSLLKNITSSRTFCNIVFVVYRYVITAEGRKRKLVIKDSKVSDAGMYKCVSNADKTEAELVVNCKSSFKTSEIVSKVAKLTL